MNTETTDETATVGKLHVFSLYADFEASKRARRAAEAITRFVGRYWRVSSEMWKLDAATAGQSIGSLMINDAANADVLIVAVSSLDSRPVELIPWFDVLETPKPGLGYSGLLIGLLGDEQRRTEESAWMVKQLIRCAQKTNRDLVWRWMEPEAQNDFTWLNENVNMLLARKQIPHENHEAREEIRAV